MITKASAYPYSFEKGCTEQIPIPQCHDLDLLNDLLNRIHYFSDIGSISFMTSMNRDASGSSPFIRIGMSRCIVLIGIGMCRRIIFIGIGMRHRIIFIRIPGPLVVLYFNKCTI